MFPHVTCFCKGTQQTGNDSVKTSADCLATTDNMRLGQRNGKTTWIVTLPGEMRKFERRASRQLQAGLERFEVSYEMFIICKIQNYKLENTGIIFL